MFGIGKKPWFWSIAFSEPITFCVWVLRMDGLPVAPFDRHPDGNGVLRALGLAEESWRAWFTDVVHHEAVWYGPHVPRPVARGSVPPLLKQTPPDAWMGDPRIGAMLAELWPRYRYLSAGSRGGEARPPTSDSAKRERATSRRMWRDLAPYRSRLDTLHVYAVDYPASVQYLVPPVSVIVDGARDLQTHPTMQRDIVRAARQLAEKRP